MDRRAFLATLSVLGLGGCVGNTTSPTGGDTSGASLEDPSSDEETPTPLSPEDVLSIDRRGTFTTDGGPDGGEQQFAEVHVENTSDESIGKVTVSADWLESDGAVQATTSEWIYAFEPGATWHASIPAEPGASPDDVETTVELRARTIDAGPLTGTDHELSVQDGRAVVSGTVDNAGDEDLFPTIFGKFFDDSDTIVGGVTAPVNSIDAGDSVTFELSFPYERVGLAAPVEYDLVLDTPDTAGADCLC